LAAFIEMYSGLGYELCDSQEQEAGFSKVAIYLGAHGKPTHAARLLDSGVWTSKLGRSQDVEHDAIEDVAALGADSTYHYGVVGAVLKRRIITAL
jgi:hypothetical protein